MRIEFDRKTRAMLKMRIEQDGKGGEKTDVSPRAVFEAGKVERRVTRNALFVIASFIVPLDKGDDACHDVAER